MAVHEYRKDYEVPIWLKDQAGFKRCWRCSSKAATAPATAAEAAYLQVPADSELCSDCAMEVPEGWTPDQAQVEKLELSKTVIDLDGPEDRERTRDEDEKASFTKTVAKWTSEEYGCWK